MKPHLIENQLRQGPSEVPKSRTTYISFGLHLNNSGHFGALSLVEKSCINPLAKIVHLFLCNIIFWRNTKINLFLEKRKRLFVDRENVDFINGFLLETMELVVSIVKKLFLLYLFLLPIALNQNHWRLIFMCSAS